MEKTPQTHGSNTGDIGGNSLSKDEQEPAAIGAIEGKGFIGEAFSSWKTWRGIDDDGPLEQRNTGVHDDHEQGDKSLEKDGEETHRIDAISEQNYASDTLTSYIRPEFTSKSWEMENAQPLMSSGQSRTHTLPRTRSLPEIRIPDDYETVVDDKLETNSLQDSVITFLSADQLHSAPLKGIDGKDLHNSGDSRADVGNFIPGYSGHTNEHSDAGVIKSVTGTSLSSNGTAYSFTVQDTDLGQHISQETASIAGTAHGILLLQSTLLGDIIIIHCMYFVTYD